MDAVEELLRTLVAIDSTSARSNLPVLDVLEPRLARLGFRTRRVEYRDDAGVAKANLLAQLGDGLPELALVGHTDCVPFDAAWTDALALRDGGDRLTGRGACDTKAFVSCAVVAAERARERVQQPLLLVFTADEEVGCVGAKKLLEAGEGRARRAIIGEPTRLTPVRANKGYCLAELTLHGKEGHSAYPDSGASAVFRAGRFLQAFEAWSLGPLRQAVDPAFQPGYATVNVGMVQGGRAKNVIPGSCHLTLEWRPIPEQAVEAVLDEVERILERLRVDDPGLEWTLRPLRMDRGFATPADADVVRFLQDETGHAPATVAFGTEGPQLAALGATPVVFGPGDIQVAHQTGEWVPKSDLEATLRVLERAILRFCG